jgi:CRISPR-associated exonuclease Cas4
VIRLLSNTLGIDLAAIIGREMISRYKIQREMSRKELEKKYGKPIVFAHEITGCSLKSEFAKKFSELDVAASFNPKMMVGEIVEYGIEKFMQSLGYTKFNDVLIMDIGDVVIAGSPDYISSDKKTLVDVKYSYNPVTREHHIDRMRIYLTLSNADRGILLYISPFGVKSYEVKEKMDISEIKTRITFVSIPRYLWECKYCTYADFCPQRRFEKQQDEVTSEGGEKIE